MPQRALLVIDVQMEYFDGALPIAYPPIETSLPNICRAMDAARTSQIPIVVVQHIAPDAFPIFARGGRTAGLHPEIAKRIQPQDKIIEKSLASAFAGTDLTEFLQEQKVDTLTIVGYMTHNCDDATVRHAAHAGWKVELLHDATGSLPYRNKIGFASAEEIHRVFTVVMHTGFAAVASTQEWLDALATGGELATDNVLSSYQNA